MGRSRRRDLAEPPAAPVSPDAELLCMSAALIAGEKESQRLEEPTFEVLRYRHPPEIAHRLEELRDEFWRLRRKIAETRAETAEGIRAKARVAMAWIAPGGEVEPPADDDEHLVWSMCRDLLGEAQPPAGIATAANPDAELIAVCAEHDQLERVCRDIYDTVPDDVTASAATRSMEDRQGVLLDQMGKLRATTADGALARAKTLAAHNPDGGFSFDHPGTFAGRLLGYLIRDAAALTEQGSS